MSDEYWPMFLDASDRAEFFTELAAATDTKTALKCVSDWRTTAFALSDPVAREILTGPPPAGGDFAEVGRPGA